MEDETKKTKEDEARAKIKKKREDERISRFSLEYGDRCV